MVMNVVMASSIAVDDVRFYFTRHQVENETPSRSKGMDYNKELYYRQLTAKLIQDMGQKLIVNQLSINTAIVYMHRFYMFHSFTDFPRNCLAPAALFLAAKMEEQPRKLEHVIKTLMVVCPDSGKECKIETRDVLSCVNVLLKTFFQCNVKSADVAYYENVLLQTLSFETAIDHPHSYVVKCFKMIEVSSVADLPQASYFMATNSLHMTTMCLQYKPSVVACVCIDLCCRWCGQEIQSINGQAWYKAVDPDVTPEMLEEIRVEFMAVLAKFPSKIKKIINMEGGHGSQNKQIGNRHHVSQSRSASTSQSDRSEREKEKEKARHHVSSRAIMPPPPPVNVKGQTSRNVMPHGNFNRGDVKIKSNSPKLPKSENAVKLPKDNGNFGFHDSYDLRNLPYPTPVPPDNIFDTEMETKKPMLSPKSTLTNPAVNSLKREEKFSIQPKLEFKPQGNGLSNSHKIPQLKNPSHVEESLTPPLSSRHDKIVSKGPSTSSGNESLVKPINSLVLPSHDEKPIVLPSNSHKEKSHRHKEKKKHKHKEKEKKKKHKKEKHRHKSPINIKVEEDEKPPMTIKIKKPVTPPKTPLKLKIKTCQTAESSIAPPVDIGYPPLKTSSNPERYRDYREKRKRDHDSSDSYPHKRSHLDTQVGTSTTNPVHSTKPQFPYPPPAAPNFVRPPAPYYCPQNSQTYSNSAGYLGVSSSFNGPTHSTDVTQVNIQSVPYMSLFNQPPPGYSSNSINPPLPCEPPPPKPPLPPTPK